MANKVNLTKFNQVGELSFAKKKMTLQGDPVIRSRSVRLPESTDEILKHQAEVEGMTVNALISTVIDDYVQWGRMAKKFPFVSLPLDEVKSVWEKFDTDALIETARREGAKVPKDVMLFWYKQDDLESFMQYLSLLSRHQGLIQFEAVKSETDVIVTARHMLGEKWSLWLKHYLEEAVVTNLGVAPVCEMSSNSITLKFDIPASVDPAHSIR
jgi:hypothetical protein